MEEPVKKQKAKYRSAIRSKRLIREAYVSLMQEKESDKISVSDIVRLADLNRGTFYAHYTNPNDVRDEIADEIFQNLNDVLNNFNFANFLTNPAPIFEKLEKIISENMKFYKDVMCYTLSIDFLSKVKESLVERIVADDSVPENVKNDPTFMIGINFFAGGMISLYSDYIQEKVTMPLPQLTSALSKITSEGIKAIIS